MSYPLKPPLFILAPMDDVTDTVFRQIVASCKKPDICFSEFVNVDGLMSPGRPRVIRKLDWHPSEAPLVAHIWGINPDNFYQVADQLASGAIATELGLKQNFTAVDLNMGCPAKQVVKTGACSALIKDQPLAKQIIEATRAGLNGRLPLSVKTRLGYKEITPDWTQFLLKQNLAMLTVHLRTVAEMSKVPAHYDQLPRLVSERNGLAPETLLIANGDIESRSEGQKLINRYGIDGVMIGRGIFHDPYAFAEQSPWENKQPEKKIELLQHHLSLMHQWMRKPDLAVARMNKYAKIYLNGFDGAKHIREQLAAANTFVELEQIVEEARVGAVDLA